MTSDSDSDSAQHLTPTDWSDYSVHLVVESVEDILSIFLRLPSFMYCFIYSTKLKRRSQTKKRTKVFLFFFDPLFLIKRSGLFWYWTVHYNFSSAVKIDFFILSPHIVFPLLSLLMITGSSGHRTHSRVVNMSANGPSRRNCARNR